MFVVLLVQKIMSGEKVGIYIIIILWYHRTNNNLWSIVNNVHRAAPQINLDEQTFDMLVEHCAYTCMCRRRKLAVRNNNICAP